MKRWFAALLLSLVVTNVGLAEEEVLEINVTSGTQGHDGPLCIPLSIPDRKSVV